MATLLTTEDGDMINLDRVAVICSDANGTGMAYFDPAYTDGKEVGFLLSKLDLERIASIKFIDWDEDHV